MKPKIVFTVFPDPDEGFYAICNVNKSTIISVGQTYDDLLEDVLEAVNFVFEEDKLVFELSDLNFESDQHGDGIQGAMQRLGLLD